jgi:hypothetical protein
MNIKGIKGMTIPQIQDEIACGGKFVRFPFCISLGVVSFRYASAVYLVKRDESVFRKGVPFAILSFLFGWWGIPWGPVYTLGCLLSTLKGGKDVTNDMIKIFHRHIRGHVFDFEKSEAFLSSN